MEFGVWNQESGLESGILESESGIWCLESGVESEIRILESRVLKSGLEFQSLESGTSESGIWILQFRFRSLDSRVLESGIWSPDS